MLIFSLLKRVRDSSWSLRNVSCYRADLGLGFTRDLSSGGDVEVRNEANHDGSKAEAVRGLLHGYGFTPHQITKVSKSFPLVFTIAVEILSPKLQFLRSILCSDDEVARVVTANPRLIGYSLKNHLMPNYEFIKSILKEDIVVAKSIKQSSRILAMDLENNLTAKVDFLKGYGFSNASISKLMKDSPGMFSLSYSKLEESLNKAKSLGFEPWNAMTVYAMRAISLRRGSNWDQKVEVYRKWGWSSDDFVLAFKKHPFIMCVSEEKINKGMDVLLNRFGLRSGEIARYPRILFFSVDERIIPRCSVIALLASKGILRYTSPSISTYYTELRRTEQGFVQKFVHKYPDHVLQLWQKLRPKSQL